MLKWSFFFEYGLCRPSANLRPREDWIDVGLSEDSAKCISSQIRRLCEGDGNKVTDTAKKQLIRTWSQDYRKLQ